MLVPSGNWAGAGGTQVNNFEQVSSDDHQMSLAEGLRTIVGVSNVPCLRGRRHMVVGACTVRSKSSCVMVK